MKKHIFISVLAVGIFISGICLCASLFGRIKIHEHIFTVEMAITPEERSKGLGYRDNMPQDYGMLFVFRQKAMHSFWMKEMRFPLDFIWIDGNRIVDITRGVPVAAGDTIPVYYPRVPVNKVLELNSGAVKNLGISAGDTLIFLD
jgi:uncharacterized protein